MTWTSILVALAWFLPMAAFFVVVAARKARSRSRRGGRIEALIVGGPLLCALLAAADAAEAQTQCLPPRPACIGDSAIYRSPARVDACEAELQAFVQEVADCNAAIYDHYERQTSGRNADRALRLQTLRMVQQVGLLLEAVTSAAIDEFYCRRSSRGSCPRRLAHSG